MAQKRKYDIQLHIWVNNEILNKVKQCNKYDSIAEYIRNLIREDYLAYQEKVQYNNADNEYICINYPSTPVNLNEKELEVVACIYGKEVLENLHKNKYKNSDLKTHKNVTFRKDKKPHD